jgi:hypothetical protein
MISMDLGSRLELNEDGVVFGICPQQNVRLQHSAARALLTRTGILGEPHCRRTY